MKKLVSILSSFTLAGACANACAGVPALAQQLDEAMGWKSVLLVPLAALFLLIFWLVVHRADHLKTWLAERLPSSVTDLPQVLQQAASAGVARCHESGLPAPAIVALLPLLLFGALAVREAAAGPGFLAVISLGVCLSGAGVLLLTGRVETRVDPLLAGIALGHLPLFIGYLLVSATGHWPAVLEAFSVGLKVYVPSAICFAGLFRRQPTSPRADVSLQLALPRVSAAALAITAVACLVLGQNLAGAVISIWLSVAVLRWFMARLAAGM